MEKVNKSIRFINEKLRRRRKIERATKNEVNSLTEKIETMDGSLDCYDQYSRRNCLLIHSVKENEKEDNDKVLIELFEKEMKEKLSANDIDRSHRLGEKINRN